MDLPPPPPAIVAAPVAFGSIGVKVGPRTTSLQLQINGRLSSLQNVRPGPRRASFLVPAGRIRVRVRARGPGGGRWSASRNLTVLPRSSTRLGRLPGLVDRKLQRDIDRLVRDMPVATGVYIQHLGTNCGASYNAAARFPGASTLKVAILVEAVRRARGKPDDRLRRNLDEMIMISDDKAANSILAGIGGGSPRVGGTRVTETLARLGLRRSLVRRGYILESGRPIAIRTNTQPSLFTNFVITPFELASLMVSIHRGARGKGGVRKLGISPVAARRELLHRLLRTVDGTKLNSGVPKNALTAHKSGYTEEVKHDAGIVYLKSGPVVMSVMSWSRSGVSDARGNQFIADVARASVKRLRRGGRCRV